MHVERHGHHGVLAEARVAQRAEAGEEERYKRHSLQEDGSEDVLLPRLEGAHDGHHQPPTLEGEARRAHVQ